MARINTRRIPKNVTNIHIEQPQAATVEDQSGKPEKQDFWTYMAGLSPKEWESHIVYITREVPKASINGMGGYLVKMTEPFDIEDIKTIYGGREFSYIMKKGNEIVYAGRFSIEAPAKLDPARELAGGSSAPAQSTAAAADTAAIVSQVMSLLREELAHSRESGQGSNSANEAVVKMLSDASEKAVEAVSRQVPQAGNPATQMKEMVSAMKEMGVIGGQSNGIGDRIWLILTPLLPSLFERLLKPVDPLAQLTSLKSLIDMAGDFGGKGGSRSGTTTNDLLLEGIKMLPSVLEQTMAARAAGAPPARRPQPHQPFPPAASTTAPPPRMPSTAGAAPAAPAIPGGGFQVTPFDDADPTTVGAPTIRQPGYNLSAEEYDNWVFARVTEMVYIGFGGEPIVEWLDTVKPQLVKDLATYSEQQINMMLGMHPAAARALDHPDWSRVLAEAKMAASEIVLDEAEEIIPEKAPLMN